MVSLKAAIRYIAFCKRPLLTAQFEQSFDGGQRFMGNAPLSITELSSVKYSIPKAWPVYKFDCQKWLSTSLNSICLKIPHELHLLLLIQSLKGWVRDVGSMEILRVVFAE